jgi:hypothetical protein
VDGGLGRVFLWAIGVDVSYLLIALGWWLVGRVLRSRREVAENLRVRAAELSAERERCTAEAVRLERTKIARELHDVVAHCMTVIVIQSRAGRHLLDSDPAAAWEALDVIVAVAAEAEADIGALVNLMDPELTRPLTRSLLDEMVTRAGATGATITAEIIADPGGLDPATGVVAHRVVQEGITKCLPARPGLGHPDRADGRRGVHDRGDQRAATAAGDRAVTGRSRRAGGRLPRYLGGGPGADRKPRARHRRGRRGGLGHNAFRRPAGARALPDRRVAVAFAACD